MHKPDSVSSACDSLRAIEMFQILRPSLFAMTDNTWSRCIFVPGSCSPLSTRAILLSVYTSEPDEMKDAVLICLKASQEHD